MWAELLLLGALLVGALLVSGEVWLRRRRQPALATPTSWLQSRTAALDMSAVKDHLRLLALGDSIVHGNRVPVDRAWPALLQERLEVGSPDLPWLVVNSGICGETAVSGLARLDRDALSFNPHVLFLAFGLNDCFLSRTSVDVWREVQTFPQRTYGPLGGSRIYQAARQRLLRESPPWAGTEPSWRPRVEPGAFVAALERMIRTAQGKRVGFIYLLTMNPVDGRAHSYWPPDLQALQMVTYHQFNDLIRDTAAARDVGLIDVEAGFTDCDLAALLDYDGVHLTSAGQVRLADIVFAALELDGTLAMLREQ